MPEWNSFLLFVAAGLLLNITPGPDVLYIVGRSLGQGRLAGVVSRWASRPGASSTSPPPRWGSRR